MILLLVVAGSLVCYAGLVSLSDRPRGASISQAGTVVGAILLFVALPSADTPVALTSSMDPVLALGIGILSATAAAMGYHLYLGRFTSVQVARGVFLIVAISIAAAFLAFLLAIGRTS